MDESFTMKVNPSIDCVALNALFAKAWPDHRPMNFGRLLSRALFHIGAFSGQELVGFARVVGDGGIHGFLLDPTVAPSFQRRGVGRQLVDLCAMVAWERGVEWLHVDYEPHLEPFYTSCGFRLSRAGLRNLKEEALLSHVATASRMPPT